MVSGTLSEIATAWRHARPSRPELPVGLPLRLENAARQLVATVQALTRAGPGQRADLAFSAAGQLSALREDIAAAKAMTCGPGVPSAGDAGLWQNLEAAMDRAGNHLLTLILHVVKIRDWSVSGPGGTAASGSGQTGLLIELG